MRKRAKVASAVAAAGVLFAGWQAANPGGAALGASVSTPTTGPSGPATAAPVPDAAEISHSPAAPSATGTAASAPSSAASGWVDGSYTGATTSNEFGQWTVTVTIKDGKIAALNSKNTAGDSKSTRINATAVPTLERAIIAANSAQVNTISGATLTSRSYLQSLQAALDQAH